MEFNEYKYLWPPRPSKAVPINLLKHYENQKWIGQFKKNGTCTVLYVQPNKEIIAKTRHDTDHKTWSPRKEFAGQFATLPGNGWYVFAGELLFNDTLYIFDLLVNNGDYLVYRTLDERLNQLRDLFPKKAASIRKSHYIANRKLWVAETISSNFVEVYEKLSSDEDEGLVLKDPQSKLNMCLAAESNSAWQIKCRKPTKNYTF